MDSMCLIVIAEWTVRAELSDFRFHQQAAPPRFVVPVIKTRSHRYPSSAPPRITDNPRGQYPQSMRWREREVPQSVRVPAARGGNVSARSRGQGAVRPVLRIKNKVNGKFMFEVCFGL